MNRSTILSRITRAHSLSAIIAILLLPLAGRSAEIVINELIAANSSVAPLTNLPTYFPDYLELYNTTSADIDLGDGRWSLSIKKNPQNFPFDYRDFFFFPTNTMIPADGYLLVFFDDKTNNPGVHTSFTVGGTNQSFTLKASGDEVLLFKDLNTAFANVPIPEDSVSFGFQVTDYSIGRIPDGTGDFTLNIPTPCGGTRPCTNNIAASFVASPSSSNEFTLKINEWLAFNLGGSGGTNDDWFEIYNPDSNNIVSLAGLVFVDRGYDAGDLLKEENQIPPLSFIPPSGFVQIIADSEGDDADTVDFSLSSTGGDDIYMFASDRLTLVDYVTLPIFTEPNISRGRLPDGGTNIVTLPDLSPGLKNIGEIPEIVISEVLPHTDPPLEDAIELQNVTTNSVDISYWWLSNDRNNPGKFQIPAGTILPPGGFAVFYEGLGTSSGFNPDGSGESPFFTLNSARGDEVYLFKGRADGSLTGDRRGVDFGPSENGVSFGRYTTSDGSSDIVAMSERTFGSDTPSSLSKFRLGAGKTNAYPKISPVIISEVHYHPPDISLQDNSLDEFIELRNTSDTFVLLFDPLFPTNQWRIKDAVSFTFPPNQRLESNELALIVSFDPETNAMQLAAFRVAFPNIPIETKIFGPYIGKLDNGGATVELAWPDHPQAPGRVDAGLVPYVVKDRLKYNDKSPWPTNADGAGGSLQRIGVDSYGNDAINWKGETPTPGQFNSPSGVDLPRIAVQPQSQTIPALKNTSLSVTARAGEKSYQWQFNGTNLLDATNATLSFVRITPEQAGPYQVVLSNAAGSVTSLVATLTVTDFAKPSVAISSPRNGARVTSASITLSGTAADKVGLNRVEYRVGSGSFQTAEGTTEWTADLDLVPGENVITARSIDTSLNMSSEISITVTFIVTSPLTLAINGSGSVSGASSGDMLEVGRSYTLTAKPDSGQVFSNWTGGLSSTDPRFTFLMESNLTLNANFVPNPFANVAGSYNGLFYDDTNGVEHGSSGFFTMKLTDRGTYSAKLLSGGYKVSAKGQFNLDGKSTNSIVNRKGTNSLAIVWCVDLAGSDTITGTVTDGGWIAALNGDRAIFDKTNPSTNAGKYTFVLPGLPHDEFVPGGSSYGTVAIDTRGNIKLKGYLADNTRAAQKVPLSKNGHWPLYVPLYSGKGSLLSWVAFTNRPTDDFNGMLNWSKSEFAKSKYYMGGFTTNEATLVGSLYTKPDRDTPVLALSDAVLIFNGGNLPEDTTNAVTIVPGSKAVTVDPLPKITLGFTLSSGLFKGSYTPANSGAKSVKFAGAVLQKTTNAFGHYFGTNQSGTVSLEAAPQP